MTVGTENTRALDQYQGNVALTKDEAKNIILTIWPKAPEVEVFKAMNICASYGLNPLMQHIFLMPFKSKDGGVTWATVLGIKATRLIAARRHQYSYQDDTPRMMTDEEQVKVFGEVDKNLIRAITILQDIRTGGTARGYGNYFKTAYVQGSDKGNSAANMAMIRSERAALDRLYPADLPNAPGLDVVDEAYIPQVTVENPTPTEDKVVEETPAEGEFKESTEPEGKKAATPATATTTAIVDKVEKPITTTQDLMEWAISHGKTFNPTWVRKNTSKDTEKDPVGCYEELKALQEWK